MGDEADAPGRAALRRYGAGRFLGRGAFAEVFEHEDSERGGGERVAIKRMLQESYRSGVSLGAVRELAALSEVGGHPSLLRLRGAFAYGGRVHMVLELAAAELGAVLRDAGGVALPAAAAKGWALQLCAALANLHAAHVLQEAAPGCANVPAGQVAHAGATPPRYTTRLTPALAAARAKRSACATSRAWNESPPVAMPCTR